MLLSIVHALLPGFQPWACGQVPPAIDADDESLDETERMLLSDSLLITDPDERSRAFERAARALLMSENYEMAISALQKSGDAAIAILDPRIRDTRLEAASATAVVVAELLVQKGIPGRLTQADPLSRENLQRPGGPSEVDRLASIDQAIHVFNLSADLASRIMSLNFRSAALDRVALILARKSGDVAVFATRYTDTQGAFDEGRSEFHTRADLLLRGAENVANAIPLPASRNRVLVKVVDTAAGSQQFARGLAIARNMEHTPSRAEALISVAEESARRRYNENATNIYQEALETVLRVPLRGPRRTIAIVLLDSLISVGRFEDARAAVSLVPQTQDQLAALSAVARAMGERGLAAPAYAWIDREAPPEFRDRLRREVADGISRWVEDKRIPKRSAIELDDLT